MNDALGIMVILGLAAAFIATAIPRKKDMRNLRGVKLSVKEWALLCDIAALKQVSQSRLVSAIVSGYLQERIADKTGVGRQTP